ncbi:Protein involved in cell division [Helicobacter fennelliae]|uniref:protein adenylyltransferase n=1 Tax=Helicobacter fennelliae TaxID=215 RepID=A0A2X3BFE4_9HELI|nr:Fic family protein [Helicobacter fennelliae]SQB99541.1 Protein involved in cell division [Helicobacter fennelliae]STQ85083.1 Protein involved in cell division [Helicobacter fennelliae]
MQYQEYALNKKINHKNIAIAIGLNEVDNLKPSSYFYQALETSSTYKELEEKLNTHYQSSKITKTREMECDLVSKRIAEIIDEEGFSFSPVSLKSIHKKLFSGVFPQGLEAFIGRFRDINIFKNEEILNNKASVLYGDFSEIESLLEYDFAQEKKIDYTELSTAQKVCSIANFISNIWQIHPFREGNTRTIATFTIKYLKARGYTTNNEIFKDNAVYFRNALVLANYENLAKNIRADFSFLYSFFESLFEDKELKPMPKCAYKL